MRKRGRSPRAVLAVLALALGAGGALAGDRDRTAGQPMIGSEAPPFELKTVEGDALALSDLRGRFVVIHFGASW